MKVIGYFPNTDFESDSQYGLRTHVFKFIQKTTDKGIDSVFILKNRGSHLKEADIRTFNYGDNFPMNVLFEVAMAAYMYYLIAKSDKKCLIYTRESPNLAPLIVKRLTACSLVCEINGIPDPLMDSPGNYKRYIDFYQGRQILLRELKWSVADHVVSVSESLKDYLVDEQGISEDDITVVENGVDTEVFSCTRDVNGDPPYDIYYVGGLQDSQNIDMMFDVVSQLDSEITFSIVGGTEEQHEPLREAVERRGIDEIVSFVPRVPHEDVPEYINDADLCFGSFMPVRPSSPVKVYEYLACGREVILVNDAGLEFLDSYPGVHRLPMSSPEKLAGEIDEILPDVSTNEKGQAKIRQERSWQAVVTNVLDICQRTVEDNTGS